MLLRSGDLAGRELRAFLLYFWLSVKVTHPSPSTGRSVTVIESVTKPGPVTWHGHREPAKVPQHPLGTKGSQDSLHRQDLSPLATLGHQRGPNWNCLLLLCTWRSQAVPRAPHLLQMVLEQTQPSCQVHSTSSLPGLQRQALLGTPLALLAVLWLNTMKKPNFGKHYRSPGASRLPGFIALVLSNGDISECKS